MSEILRLEELSRTFQTQQEPLCVLNQVDLRVNKGEFVVIEGASGSGKSTLLHIIGLLDDQYKGMMTLNDQDVSQWSSKEKAQWRNENLGFIFQFFHLISSLSALENVMMPLLIGGCSHKFAKHKSEIWLERVGLKDRMDHNPMELSGGEQQRVAIARAFVHDPCMILCDEPTGNLDDETSALIESLILDLNQSEEKTILLITHDLRIAEKHSQRYHINHGNLSRFNPE